MWYVLHSCQRSELGKEEVVPAGSQRGGGHQEAAPSGWSLQSFVERAQAAGLLWASPAGDVPGNTLFIAAGESINRGLVDLSFVDAATMANRELPEAGGHEVPWRQMFGMGAGFAPPWRQTFGMGAVLAAEHRLLTTVLTRLR